MVITTRVPLDYFSLREQTVFKHELAGFEKMGVKLPNCSSLVKYLYLGIAPPVLGGGSLYVGRDVWLELKC